MTRSFRLTRWQRFRARLRTYTVRVLWLWRRLPGCECDPDGYGLHDIPQPICETYWRRSLLANISLMGQRLAEALDDIDQCDTCGHEYACHAQRAAAANSGRGENA